MSILFSADEAFEMAERIETNGTAFYRRAASLQSNPGMADKLLKLAAMEDQHRRIFADMRRQLAEREKEETAFDPDGEAALYRGAMADTRGGEGVPAITAKLTGQETLDEILSIAIGLEKQSILF